MAFVDETINALRVMRTPAFSGSVVSVASHDRISNLEKEITEASGRTHGKSALPTKSKVPRPPNAFILYRQHHHPRIKEAYPDFTNNEICKFPFHLYSTSNKLTTSAIILGKQWKAESEEVKMQFRNMAEKLKKKHAEDHPDYHYTPRKPSEKKRRASSRQYSKPTKRQKSPALTNDTSDSSTPSMYSGMQLDNIPVDASLDNLADIDIVLSPDELPRDCGLQFDSVAFDNFLQQVQGDCGKTAATLFPQFNFTERPVGESFEFSDLIADCYWRTILWHMIWDFIVPLISLHLIFFLPHFIFSVWPHANFLWFSTYISIFCTHIAYFIPNPVFIPFSHQPGVFYNGFVPQYPFGGKELII